MSKKLNDLTERVSALEFRLPEQVRDNSHEAVGDTHCDGGNPLLHRIANALRKAAQEEAADGR